MSKVKFLHFSDLHFGKSNHKWLWPTYKKEFFNDIRKLHEKSGSWDFVIFSGDLTQSGKVNEFDGLTKELEDLWNLFGQLGSYPLLLTVPGNHDLVRPDPTKPFVRALNAWESDQDLQKIFWDESDNEYLTGVNSCFENYSNWYDKLNIPKPKSIEKGYIAGDFSTQIKIDGIQIGIVGLNSSFLQITDANYFQKLSLNEKQVHLLCAGNADVWSDKNDISLLIMHHPPSWLSKDSLSNFNSEISPNNRFFANLCGHLHESKVISSSNSGYEQCKLWQGNSLFGMENIDGQTIRSHGYSLFELDISADETILKIWPRISKESYDGSRKIVPDQGFNLIDENYIEERTARISKKVNSDIEKLSQDVISETGLTTSLINTEVSKIEAETFIEKLPTYIINEYPQDEVIRTDLQVMCAEFLDRNRYSWIVADWGQGKIGFLYSILKYLESDNVSILRIKCGNEKTIEELEKTIVNQLGVTLSNFYLNVSVIQNVYLVLDDIPSELSIIDNLEKNKRLFEYVEAILDYCPYLKIILISRQKPVDSRFISLELKSLTLLEVKLYVERHAEFSYGLADSETIEKLLMLSGGLPMHLDRFLKELKTVSLQELIDSEQELGANEDFCIDGVPDSLVKAVIHLENSDDKFTQRSYSLLKLLSILSSGEPLKKIKRFNNSEPFYPKNATELSDLCMLESIPILISDTFVNEEKGAKAFNEVSSLKLLKVPRQVRDYVITRISDNEKEKIVDKAAEVFFGNDWKTGKIKKMESHEDEGGAVRHDGVGNEYELAETIIRKAIKSGEAHKIERAVRLGIGYCNQLVNVDRYKDVCIVSGEFYHLLEGLELENYFYDIAFIYANSLRMVGNKDKALVIIKKILDGDTKKLPKNDISDMHLELAFAYDSENKKNEALEFSNLVIKNCDKHSNRFMQAKYIIEKYSDRTEGEKIRAFKRLELNARKKGSITLANNLCLDIARLMSSEESLLLLQKVIETDEGIYNKVRGIINKVEIIVKLTGVESISSIDRGFLSVAYSYLYSQRLNSLFNRCNRIIWGLFESEERTSNILTLFKHSSFNWRLTGNEDIEKDYIEKVNDYLSKSEIDSYSELESYKYYLRRKNIYEN